MLRGVDVSHHQGRVDWPALTKRHGMAFAFAKATEGVGFTDPEFARNWRGMAAAGLVRGAYHFARPDSDPADDVARFVEVVQAAGALLPTDLLCLDLETSALGRTATHDWARGWGLELRRVLPGFAPVLYAGVDYMSTATGAGLVEVFGTWWLPRWPANRGSWPGDLSWVDARHPEPNRWGRLCDFWQWTDRLDGAGLDANLYRGSLVELQLLNPGARGRPVPVPPPVPAPPTSGETVIVYLQLAADGSVPALAPQWQIEAGVRMHLSKVRRDALKAKGVTVTVVPLPADAPEWALPVADQAPGSPLAAAGSDRPMAGDGR